MFIYACCFNVMLAQGSRLIAPTSVPLYLRVSFYRFMTDVERRDVLGEEPAWGPSDEPHTSARSSGGVQDGRTVPESERVELEPATFRPAPEPAEPPLASRLPECMTPSAQLPLFMGLGFGIVTGMFGIIVIL